VGEEFFNPKYKTIGTKEYKFTGNSFQKSLFENLPTEMIKVSKDMVLLTEHIFVFHHFRKHNEFEQKNPKFFVRTGEEYTTDDFTDEIALGILTKKGLVVVVGCSHVGIVNILKTISERMNMPIYAVVGGTHLVDAEKGRVRKTIEMFREMKIQIVAVSHCTGEEGILMIQESMKKQFVHNNTGHVIEI
jgi:7,8-dihydropterin-6-yl-methyl-4-(beta-D-ribofuranosyl)aminobenzene 5'-phosphate synthase